jgi:alpha-L-rhamnosidase
MNKLKSSLFQLLILFCLPLFSQQVKWTAQWIMHPTVQPQEGAQVLFRKSFELVSKPQKFVVHLSADNHYRLFVNGKYVLRGPARGDISHWFYETIDLAHYLKAGKNLLAVEVINWGPKRSFTYFSQMTSFVMQGDSEAEKVVNTFGDSWKCYHNKAFTPKPVDWMMNRNSIDFGLYVGSPTDSIRAELHPWDWEKNEYDDSTWLPAKWCDIAGSRIDGSLGGILYGNGKLLVPRVSGLLREERVPFNCIRRTSGIEKNEDFIHNNGALTVPANSQVSILIDQKEETMGYPEMMVSLGKNATIKVRYAENLIVKNQSPKGDRNDIEEKRLVGIQDVFVSDGGTNRLFKPSYLRAFRYIQLDIQTQNEPLKIESYYHISCQAPIDLKAKFETKDTLLSWMMDAGWRTVSICAQDILSSDAAYEQMQYVGDSRVHNLALLTLTGDDRLTRNALIQFDQSRIPDGLTLGCYPNAFYLVIPSYSLMWIDQVHDYMMWKDDKEFISKFELGMHSVIDWFEKRRQPNGLLGKMEWWNALGWPRHYVNGEPEGIKEGGNALYSLHYAYTLQHAAEVFEYLGKPVQAQDYKKRADEIVKAVNLLCKNQDGFYTESPSNKKVSQITNVMAILADAAKGKEAEDLMRKLLETKDWYGQVDLFLHLYLFEAMNKTGFQEQFISELTEWKLMQERGMSTYAEVPLEWGEENQRSECHPWSAAPNYFFFRTICGIKPLAIGHFVVEIAPSFGALKQMNVVYPHQLGNIEMNLKKEGTHVSGSITIPTGMKASFKWEGKENKLKSGVQNKINF